MVHSSFEDSLFSLLDTAEDERFVIVVSVGTHTKEDFSGVGILLEGIIETKDWISGS